MLATDGQNLRSAGFSFDINTRGEKRDSNTSHRWAMKIIESILLGTFCIGVLFAQSKPDSGRVIDIARIDRSRILSSAERFLKEEPVTITSSSSARSAGGKHDFFSESDYWWPNPKNPDRPYIRRDGMTNPDNFVEHRLVMRRLSIQVPALTAAYLITKDAKHAKHAIKHLRAWFVAEETRMNPSMQYAQAVKGVSTGRDVGIIDALHLVEVSRSVMVLEKEGVIDKKDLDKIKHWFRDYNNWLTTSKNGYDEKNQKNNHGTEWILQVAAYAQLVGDKEKMDFCRRRFKEVVLPRQMAQDGSFPEELARTKPYSYSIFNLDLMAAICQILSDEHDNLFRFTLPDGRNLKKGMEFMYPFIADKNKWRYPPDVMYYEFFPNRQPCLLFAGLAYNEEKYLDLWSRLNPDPDNEEVIRNFPIRQPILWIN